MPDQTIKSPDDEILRLVARIKTTSHGDNSIKPIDTRSETIEVLVSDSRIISSGSQFGHVAIAINDKVYGRAPSGWDEDGISNYLNRQQAKMNRDTVGFVLRASPEQKEKLLGDISRRKLEHKNYNLATDSCSSNAAELLGSIGIISHDPRWSTVVTPTDMAVALKRSKRLVKTNYYPRAK
jgi:hypothetical protein